MTAKAVLSVTILCSFPEVFYVASWSCDNLGCITEQFLNFLTEFFITVKIMRAE